MLTIKNVTKRFYDKSGTVTILDDVTFDLPSTGFIALCGKSGCGKTTLLKMIAGDINDFEGKILYDGEDVLNYSFSKRDNFYSNNIFYLKYTDNFFGKLTVKESISFYLNKKEQSMMYDYINKFSLNSLLNKKISNISSGELQKVSLCFALAKRAKITILDENIKKTQNSKWKKENIMLKKRLKNRNLSYYYDYTLINNFMNQDFQYLLSLIFCIILVIKLFIYEKQKQTDLYFYISRKQIKKIFISKILMILLFTFISSLLLLIESYLIYYFLGMKNGLFQPLYALSHFMYEPYNISIFFYIVCNYFFRLVGCLSFSYLFLFLCHFLNKEYKGFFIAILIIYISIQLYNNNLLSIISFSSLNDSIYNQRIFISSLLFSFIILNLNFFTYFLFKRRYYVSIN